MTSERLRVIHWGCGRWGKNVLRVLAAHPGVHVACVVDPDPSARELAAKIAPHAEVTSPEFCPDLARFDAASVVTPAITHHDIALTALAAGLHVFVEKPLATSSVQAETLVRVNSGAGVVAMVGHLLCCHPAFERALQMIEQGTIGVPVALSSQRFSLASSREVDGSLFLSLGPHDLSLMRCVDPSPVGKLRAEQSWVGISDQVGRPANVAGMRLETETGLVTTLSLSRAHATKVRRVRFEGSDGTIIVDDLAGEDRKILLKNKDGDSFVSYETASSPLEREIDVWIRAILGKKDLMRNTFEDGAAVVRLIERAQRVVMSSSRSSMDVGLTTR